MSARNELPPAPYYEAPVTHIVRRVTVSIGPLQIVREEHRYHGDAPRSPALRRSSFAGWYPAALAAFLCLGAGGIALAATGASPRGDYSVSIPVPDRPPVAKPRKKATAPRHVRQAATAPAAATPPSTDEEAVAQFDAAESGTGLSRAAAINAALDTGEMQEWRAGTTGEGGFVVAGPADREGARACRSLSILTRSSNAPDRVDQRRECRREGGG